MKRLILALMILAGGTAAASSVTQKRVEMENIIRQRVFSVIEKADPVAIVHVRVNLKRVKAVELPVMGFGAQVTPVEFDGDLGPSSIDNIEVRIVTQIENVADWIRKEVESAATISTVKLNISYEKAGGPITDSRRELSQLAKETAEVAVKGFEGMRLGIWVLIAGVVLALGAIGFSIFSLAGRLQTSISAFEEKILPALAEGGRGGSGPRDLGGSRDKGEGKSNAVGGQMNVALGKELADLPVEALLTLFGDCYWTESDAYAHYLWTQITQEQREKILQSGLVEGAYFSFIRQFTPENLGYHLDARYLMAGREFPAVNQTDLLEWVRKNPKRAYRVTPLRWDKLPLSLAERIEFHEQQKGVALAISEPINIKSSSKPRTLVMQLEIKSLRPEDEDYLWANSGKIPADVRPSLRSLVWLAQAPFEYRQRILADLDAGQLAEAWAGPADALAKLKEALPPKKIEMLEHFLRESAPSRDSDAFQYLVDAGLNSPSEDASAPPAEEAA